MENTSRPAEHLRSLTSLRFVAASMIVLLHYKEQFSDTWPWIKHMPATLVQGVSFFFVLSGFILTHVYLNRPVSYGRFIWTRLARLWPVHFVTLLYLILFIRSNWVTFDGPGIFDRWVVLPFNLTLTQALIPYQAYEFSYNGVSWSISTEMAFYLAFPFLLINIERTWHWKLGISALLVVIFCVAARVFPENGDVYTINIVSLLSTTPLVRGFEFCLGMASYVIWRRYAATPVSVPIATAVEAAVLAGTVMWLLSWFWYAQALLPRSAIPLHWFGVSGSCWVFAILIVTMAGGHGLVTRALSTAPFVWLGEISFALYMVHVNVLKVFMTQIAPEWRQDWIMLPLVIAVAAAVHHLVEVQARKCLLALPSKIGRWSEAPTLEPPAVTAS